MTASLPEWYGREMRKLGQQRFVVAFFAKDPMHGQRPVVSRHKGDARGWYAKAEDRPGWLRIGDDNGRFDTAAQAMDALAAFLERWRPHRGPERGAA